MTAGSQLFAPSIKGPGFADIPFGMRHPTLHRYKLPLLPGEEGTKAGGDWVPRGVQSATNLAGAISESRALGIWERERSQLGLALRSDLYEQLSLLVNTSVRLNGVDLRKKLREQGKPGQALIDGLAAIHEEAREACGANAAAIEGTNRHDVWELKGATGQLFGTPSINAQLTELEQLLQRSGLERVPGLQERVVRHVELNCAGRFDDVLRATRAINFPVATTVEGHEVVSAQSIPMGTLLMADLKTKRTPFFSLLEQRIQLAVYATAELLLDGEAYVVGPRSKVHQQWGVILHMPADGEREMRLMRVNLQRGLELAQLARRVCDARSESKSVAAFGEAMWPEITS